jgi:hypothetical protein
MSRGDDPPDSFKGGSRLSTSEPRQDAQPAIATALHPTNAQCETPRVSLSQLAPGLLWWTARHPEWHPGGFGDEVCSYALDADDHLLLVDPLLPEDEPEPVLDALDAMLRTRVAILVTIGYHVRSAGSLWERWHGDTPVTIHGPPQAARRLAAGAATAFEELQPGTPGPAGVEAFAIGRPRRGEGPLWLPSHASLAFGDAVVTTPGGELRMWAQEPVDDRRLAFYRDRFGPTLEPLLDLPVRRVLVTHGAPVVEDGAAALRDAIRGRPWSSHD